MNGERPITIALVALGGQGGGVLTRWLVDLAERNEYVAQSTYVAGVAQRTGATVYCIEMFPAGRRTPVFTPYPVPGDVDLVVAGELAEAGRAIQKGFVTPNITTLLASSHRVYSIAEKEAMGDGIVDQQPVIDIAHRAAKQFVLFDMEAAAQESDSIISAIMLGAISASGVLPFEKSAYEQVIRDTGRAVESNLAGFAAGARHARDMQPLSATTPESITVEEPRGPNGRALAARIANELPAPTRVMAMRGALRCLDYQDAAYADTYIDTVVDIAAKDTSDQEYVVTLEVARQLALQMCYEDTIRVADLKTRGARARRVREHLGVDSKQPTQVVEYFHPRLEEVCDTLPENVAKYVLASPKLQKVLKPFFSKGRMIKTTSLSGFLLLRSIAGMRRWRRSTYRFGVQETRIAIWLHDVTKALREDYDYGVAVAESVEMVKGYGETYERGLQRYQESNSLAESAASNRGELLRRLRRAAEADEKGLLFAQTKSELETLH